MPKATSSAKKSASKPAAKKGAAKTAEKPDAKKAPAEKPAPAKGGPIREEWAGAGAKLVELFEQAGTKDAASAKKLASKLGEAKATNADLVALRDVVNATAAHLRSENKGALAKQFSKANMLVRRAERATRKEGA